MRREKEGGNPTSSCRWGRKKRGFLRGQLQQKIGERKSPLGTTRLLTKKGKKKRKTGKPDRVLGRGREEERGGAFHSGPGKK